MRAYLRLFCAAWLLCGAMALAAPRTFTDSTGRVLSAEIVSATSDTVTLKMDTGATISIPQARLSQADQAYVGDWLKSHAPSAAAADATGVTPVRYAFGVTWDKVKTGEKKVKIQAYSGEEEEWACKFKITNLSNVPLSDVELRYQVHVSLERTGNVATNEYMSAKETVTLPRNQPMEITTKSVPLLRLKLDSGYITTDRSRGNKRDSIKGFALGVFHKGVLVNEYRSPGIPTAPFTEKEPEKSPRKSP